MLRNLKLIFIHGINDHATNYSQGLYLKTLSACRTHLKSRGHSDAAIDQMLNKVVHHEVLWADLTTDLTNRYLQLAYQHPHWFWSHFTRGIDPLGLQIMQYIKDKGDKPTGSMNILREVDHDIRRIFSFTDIGEDPLPEEGQNAIFVTHSLGSVIAFDYIMGFRKAHQLDPNITVKSFITMGSPLSLFTSAMGYPDSDFVLPAHVKKWVNIFSRRDGIARPMQPFFRNIPIEEREVTTRFLPLPAHTAYWSNHQTAAIIAGQVLKALA